MSASPARRIETNRDTPTALESSTCRLKPAFAFGDLFLADVRAFRDAMLDRQGWHGAYPLCLISR